MYVPTWTRICVCKVEQKRSRIKFCYSRECDEMGSHTSSVRVVMPIEVISLSQFESECLKFAHSLMTTILSFQKLKFIEWGFATRTNKAKRTHRALHQIRSLNSRSNGNLTSSLGCLIFLVLHTHTHTLSHAHILCPISHKSYISNVLSRCVMRKCFGNGFRFFENQMHLQLLVYVSSFNPSLSLWVGPSYLLTHIHGQCVMTPPLQLYPENKKTKKQQSNSIRFIGKSTESKWNTLGAMINVLFRVCVNCVNLTVSVRVWLHIGIWLKKYRCPARVCVWVFVFYFDLCDGILFEMRACMCVRILSLSHWPYF